MLFCQLCAYYFCQVVLTLFQRPGVSGARESDADQPGDEEGEEGEDGVVVEAVYLCPQCKQTFSRWKFLVVHFRVRFLHGAAPTRKSRAHLLAALSSRDESRLVAAA